MHSSTCDLEPPRLGGAEVFVAIAALVTEGRTPSSKTTPAKAAAEKSGTPTPAKHRSGTGFSEGPHCTFSKASQGHVCNLDNLLCIKYDKIRSYVLSLWQKSLPLCIDVLLVPNCCCENDLVCNPSTSQEPIGFAMLLEQWNINVLQRRTHDFTANLNINQLISAIRSQLYFSQISAWLASPDEKIRSSFQDKTIVYCLTVPGETFGCKTFASNAQHHNFPTADLGNGVVVKVSLSNVPRTEEIPHIKCSKCHVPINSVNVNANTMMADGHHSAISVLDDRMQMSCTLKGKHRCDDYEDFENNCGTHQRYKRNYLNVDVASTNAASSSNPSASTSRNFFGNLSNLQGTTSKSKQQQQHLINSNVSVADHKCDMKSNDVVAAKGILGKCEKSDGGAPKVDLELSRKEFVEVLSVLRQSVPMKSQNTKKHDLANSNKNQGDILLDAILRSSKVQQSDEDANKIESEKSVSPSSPNSLERHKRKGATFLKSLYPDVVGSDGGDGDGNGCMRVGDNMCDNKNDSIISDNRSLGGNDNIYIDINCDNIKRKKTTDYIKMCDISNVFSLEYLQKRQKVKVKQKITFDDNNHYYNNHHQNEQPLQLQMKTNKCNKHEEVENDDICLNKDLKDRDAHSTNAGIIPSALEQAKFRKSLDNAASMVFHSRTGLPLTSSPAPVRRGKSCFDFDSSINSVSAIRSALFSLASCSTDEDSESDCSIVSPCSPETTNGLKQREIPLINYRHRGQSSGLLGSFVESVLNGRLEPVSTVHGFSAELGASGSFCPRHVVLPVTVFFYTLGDNDKVSTPYLGHINLGKKGYNVPKSGTIQVTLFNPLGTVVKMFVIMYDLSDMPPNSQTFIRQRTLFMPANCEDKNLEWSQKWLRYLIHLRFMSSKSGRIYLHSDIRMIICRKSDLDTATAHGIDMSYELRSFINSPTNPRFSPRK